MGKVSDIGSKSRSDTVCLDRKREMMLTAWNYRADGLVGGGIAFAIIGDHENRPTDMTNVIVYEKQSKEENENIQSSVTKCRLPRG